MEMKVVSLGGPALMNYYDKSNSSWQITQTGMQMVAQPEPSSSSSDMPGMSAVLRGAVVKASPMVRFSSFQVLMSAYYSGSEALNMFGIRRG